MKPRLVVVAPVLGDAVRCAGGWLFDQAMAGWDVTVLTAEHADPRPLRILGAHPADLDCALASPVAGPRPHAIAVGAELYRSDARVRRLVRTALDEDASEVRLWGGRWPADLDHRVTAVPHRLSTAARAFKAQALAAVAGTPEPGDPTEMFRRSLLVRA